MRIPRTRPSLQRACVIQDLNEDDEDLLKARPIQLFQTLLEVSENNEEDKIEEAEEEQEEPKRKKKVLSKNQDKDINDEAKKEEEEIKKLQKYYDAFDDFELDFEVKVEPSGSIDESTYSFSQLNRTKTSHLNELQKSKYSPQKENESQSIVEEGQKFDLSSHGNSILQESSVANIFEDHESKQFFSESPEKEKSFTFDKSEQQQTKNLPSIENSTPIQQLTPKETESKTCETEEKENQPQQETLDTQNLTSVNLQSLPSPSQVGIPQSPAVQSRQGRSFNRLSALNFSPIGTLLTSHSPAAANQNYFTSTPVRREAPVPETPGSLITSVIIDDRNKTIDDRNTTRNTTRIVSFYDANISLQFNKLPFYLEGYEGAHDNHFDQLLFTVQQHASISWEELNLKTPRKLGEGVYGEVYSCKYRGQLSAVKIIPFNNDIYRYEGKVNGETLWEPQEILPEVLLTRELSSLNSAVAQNSTSNFIKLLGAHVVKGVYPKALLKAWDVFNKERQSENDRPSEYSSPNQHFMAICLSMGGIDLENSQMENEAQCISLLLQVTLSLLIAEEELEFEHRDLHVGNVLVEPYDGNINYRYRGQNVSIASHGIKVNIIDFTLSRLKKGGTALMRDLESDEELFQGRNDYQFEIYRMMREENGRDWLGFTRKTNVFWLHYLADYLLVRKKCKNPITKKRQKVLMETMDIILKKDGLNDFLSGEEFTQLISPFIIIHEE